MLNYQKGPKLDKNGQNDFEWGKIETILREAGWENDPKWYQKVKV